MSEWVRIAIATAAVLLVVLTVWSVCRTAGNRKLTQFTTVADNVFFSYKSENAPVVRFVAEQLIASGQNVWFNEYRVPLNEWEVDFEERIEQGVAAAAQAVFFTNSLWAGSKWCFEVEALELLKCLRPDSDCLEVRIPPGPEPHIVVPQLKEMPFLDATKLDRWQILEAIRANFAWAASSIIQPAMVVPNFQTGIVSGVSFKMNVAGWKTGFFFRAETPVDIKNKRVVFLSRVENGTSLSVNILAGLTEIGERRFEDLDEREVFAELRELAREYYDHGVFRGECIGVHLLRYSGRLCAAFTYWGGNYWCRRYSIIYPGSKNLPNTEVAFTCSVHGDFSAFCKNAFLFDDLVASFQV